MAERDEQRRTAEVEAAGSGLSLTGRAVGLARVLHHECVRLLQPYKDKETFLEDHAPDGERIVSLFLESDRPGAEQQVQALHAALCQCLGLLQCLIQKEEEEWGELEGEYETMRTTVRVWLEHLLYSTKDLVETEDVPLEVTPDHQCAEEPHGAGGALGLKLWTYGVLLELIRWADHTAQTLHVLHKERGGLTNQ